MNINLKYILQQILLHIMQCYHKFLMKFVVQYRLNLEKFVRGII
jgi:hypothetical protein